MSNTAKVVQLPVFQNRPEELLTVMEAAQEFGIGRDKLYQLAHTVLTTGFPALWFGPKTVKFPKEALRIWLNSEQGRKALYRAIKSK